MGRPEGTIKTGGRQAGTANKKTLAFKEFLDGANFSIPERLLEILPTLTEDRQVDVLLKLMAYVYPKFKSIELKTEADSGPETFAEWAQKNAEAYEKRKAERQKRLKSIKSHI